VRRSLLRVWYKYRAERVMLIWKARGWWYGVERRPPTHAATPHASGMRIERNVVVAGVLQLRACREADRQVA